MNWCCLYSGLSSSCGIILPCAPGKFIWQLFNHRYVILQHINKVIHIKYIHE
uniref:Uncharacterized protein MANES_12G126600 n=1 Tax=Rhizophora mucronata TaxID=61149 RepID=A0A2P2MNF0_RHIMU